MPKVRLIFLFLCVWSSVSPANEPKPKATLQGHKNYIWSVAFSPNGKLLASGSADKTIKLWDTATGKVTATLLGHDDDVYAVAFSPDGSLLASGSGDEIKLWEVATGKVKASLEEKDRTFLSVAFSPDGNMLASGRR